MLLLFFETENFTSNYVIEILVLQFQGEIIHKVLIIHFWSVIKQKIKAYQELSI